MHKAMLLNKLRSCRFMIVLLFLFLLAACSKTEREEEVYLFIEQAVELAEGHQLGALMDLTQDGFTAGPGNHSSKDVRRILFVTFKRFGRFRIHYPRPSVRLSEEEDTAIVRMNFLLTTADKPIPELELLYEDSTAWIKAVDERSDLYTLSLELGYESGDWLVKKARITSFTRPHGLL